MWISSEERSFKSLDFPCQKIWSPWSPGRKGKYQSFRAFLGQHPLEEFKVSPNSLLQTACSKQSQRPLLILLPRAYVCIWSTAKHCCFALLRSQEERNSLSLTRLRGKEKCLLTALSYPPVCQGHVLCIVQRANVLRVFGGHSLTTSVSNNVAHVLLILVLVCFVDR